MEFAPYTSKDLDYFGQRKAAEKLAEALNGTIRVPSMDNATPETAIVEAVIDGRRLEIDFLGHVKGVRNPNLERAAVELLLNVRTEDGVGTIAVPIMHPLHCLQSRLANVVLLGRKDDTSRRQLEAAPIVLREYISQALNEPDSKEGHKEATSTLRLLFDYLRSDEAGRRAHLMMRNDPAAILTYFVDDARLDERYRSRTLASLIQQLADRRTAWGRMKSFFRRTPPA